MKTKHDSPQEQPLSVLPVSGSADAQPIQEIPSRIKYYLLDWKEKNIEVFIEKFGDVKLRDLTKSELHELFIYASAIDLSNWNIL